MADKFSTADERNLLSQPGYFYSRDYGSVGTWDKSVFMNGSTYQVNTESVEIAFEDIGTVRDEISNETVDVSISAGQVLDLDLISRLTGGLYSASTVDGTPVTGASQTVASGDWEYNLTVLFEGQNASGLAPSITSVTAGTDGVLLVDEDYFLTKLDGAGWAIVFVDSLTITTEAQAMVVIYDYTPAASSTITRGGVKIVDPIELAFQTIASSQVDGTDEYVTYYFYKCFTNGNIGHGFSPENDAAPITMDLGFVAKKDTNRATGDQLYKVVRGDSYLG